MLEEFPTPSFAKAQIESFELRWLRESLHHGNYITMTTIGTAQPIDPTPSQGEFPSSVISTYASYIPHDLKYNADFEDSLINAVLSSNGKQVGIRLIQVDRDEQAVEGDSVRLS